MYHRNLCTLIVTVIESPDALPGSNEGYSVLNHFCSRIGGLQELLSYPVQPAQLDSSNELFFSFFYMYTKRRKTIVCFLFCLFTINSIVSERE